MLSKEEFTSKVQSLGSLMGYDVAINTEYKYDRHATLKQGFEEIHLSNGGYRAEDKISIYGSYPRAKTGEMSYINTTVPINVSDSKSAEQISKDIARRFLLDYRANLDKALKQINATNEAEEQAEKDIETIKAGFPEIREYSQKEQKRRTILYLGGRSKIEIAYNGNGKHRIELDELSTEQIITILQIVNEPKSL